jgi:hypothetical protein
MTGEHWRQWIATLGPMIVFALGIGFWVVSAINQVHEEITLVKADLIKVITDTKADSTKSITDVLQKLLADEGRINTLERSLDTMKTDEKANQAEVHNSLSQIFNAVSDMRVSLAKQGNEKGR